MNTDKVYKGKRQAGALDVTVVEPGGRTKHLPLYLGVRNHSPDGFNAGYSGSGPAQLALAMCIDALDGDEDRALAIYQTFKKVIAGFDPSGFEISRTEVLAHIHQMEQDKTYDYPTPQGK